jgi:hypothetical protein
MLPHLHGEEEGRIGLSGGRLFAQRNFLGRFGDECVLARGGVPLDAGRRPGDAWSRALVAMEVEEVPVDVFDRELSQAPRLLRERLHDPRAARPQLLVCSLDVGREYPVDARLEWVRSPAKEDRADAVARDGADATSWLQPTDLEAEGIAIVALGALHVVDRELRRGMSELRA